MYPWIKMLNSIYLLIESYKINQLWFYYDLVQQLGVIIM
jgi:hypothetical protein